MSPDLRPYGLKLACLFGSLALALSAAEVKPEEVGPKLDAVIDQLQSHYNHAQTLSVHFVENYDRLGHPRPPEEGTLTLRKQGKMRWDYSQPAGKLFLSDGKTLFLYTATDNRVERLPLKQTEDLRAPLAFLLGKVDLRREFGGINLQSQPDGDFLVATAKTASLPYHNVEMLVEHTGAIRLLRVHGRDQSTVTLNFTGEHLNLPVPDSLFHFVVPTGAQVVDGIEEQGDTR